MLDCDIMGSTDRRVKSVVCYKPITYGATENVGVENAAPSLHSLAYAVDWAHATL